MTQHDIIEKVKQNRLHFIKYAIADIDGVMRGKIIHKEKFLEIIEKGVGFCNVIFGWDIQDDCYNNVEYTGWHSGYPDANVKLDLSSYRTIPWENHMPLFIADLHDKEKSFQCPRSMLRTIREQAKAMGLNPIFSLEYEWFNFEGKPQQIQPNGNIEPKPITPGMFGYSLLRPSLNKAYYNQLMEELEQFDIRLEGIHTETGPGVYEAAIRHDDILRAADKATLFKSAVKEIGYQHNITASFMAKWNVELPGCGGHIHQSLWNDAQQNLFFDASQPNNMSETMQQYIAGQLYCLPHILPFYAPTINSYKRLVEGAWAPTTLTWGIDNRTCALRILNHDNHSSRVEMRVPGADVNPYLAMAASLASGLYGIRHQLKLSQLPTVGNGYQQKENGVLPKDLNEATQIMKSSEVAKELFGASFINHFAATRQWEWKQFSQAVTNWEINRYFEQT